MNYWTVIPAAGQGKRMNAGISKQWIELLGRPVLAYTLDVFEKDPKCKGVILVGSQQELKADERFCTEHSNIQKCVKSFQVEVSGSIVCMKG